MAFPQSDSSPTYSGVAGCSATTAAGATWFVRQVKAHPRIELRMSGRDQCRIGRIALVRLRRTGIALIVIGAVMSLVALTADLTGLGDDPGFQVGPQQWLGILLGLAVLVVGAVLLRRAKAS